MKANLKKALEIDPNLGEAHALLGIIYANFDWDWQSAEQELKQAVQLNPNSAHIHYLNAWFLTISGRHEEAVAEAKRAQKLDPISPLMNGFLGTAYSYGGQYDNAIEVLQMTLNLNPNFYFTHIWLGFAYLGKSMLDAEKKYPISQNMNKNIEYSRILEDRYKLQIFHKYNIPPVAYMKILTEGAKRGWR